MLILIAIVTIPIITCIGQTRVENDSIDQNKYILEFIPSKANNIYGFAVGLIGSKQFVINHILNILME